MGKELARGGCFFSSSGSWSLDRGRKWSNDLHKWWYKGRMPGLERHKSTKKVIGACTGSIDELRDQMAACRSLSPDDRGPAPRGETSGDGGTRLIDSWTDQEEGEARGDEESCVEVPACEMGQLKRVEYREP